MLNIQQLMIFATAARCQTLTEAAEELGFSQPTVSFHLRNLEEQAGAQLFRKYHRRLHLTDAGRALLPYAQRIVSLCKEASQLMEDHLQQRTGSLRLGASYTPATYWLPELLSAYRREKPGVHIQMTVKKAELIQEIVRSGEIDIGIVSDTPTHDPELTTIPLIADELLLLFHPDHPLADKEELTIADLQNQSFLVHETGATSRRLAEQWAADNGLNLRISMELGAIETIKEAVRCGIDIGILPKRSIVREVQRGEFIMRELPNGVNRRFICLIYRTHDLLSPAAKGFIQFVQVQNHC